MEAGDNDDDDDVDDDDDMSMVEKDENSLVFFSCNLNPLDYRKSVLNK